MHVVMQAGREGSRVDGSHNRDDIYRAILAINHDGWQPPAAEDSLSFFFPISLPSHSFTGRVSVQGLFYSGECRPVLSGIARFASGRVGSSW